MASLYRLAADAGGIGGVVVDGVVVGGVLPVLGVVDGAAGSAGRFSQATSMLLAATSAAMSTVRAGVRWVAWGMDISLQE